MFKKLHPAGGIADPVVSTFASRRRSFAALICGIFLLQNILCVVPTAAQKRSEDFKQRTSQRQSAAPLGVDTPISLTAFNVAASENFDSLVNTGTSSVTPAGWGFAETGMNANTTYTAGTGSGTGGDTYSLGAANSAERALGALRSGSLVPIIGASYTNNTGSTINSLAIAYTGEEWRLGTTARTDRIYFQYSISATSLTTGTWTDVNALDFVTPSTTGTAGLRDGNAAANRTAITSTVTGISIPAGTTFFIRWTDLDASGADDALAVDDFSLTPGGNPNTPTNPSGTGGASPSTVAIGSNSLLTVTVTPGTNPASTNLAVSADLTSIGGAANQTFFNDGTNGDITPGDNIFSYNATVSGATTAGSKSLPATITDAQSRTGTANIALTVTSAATNPAATGSASPNSVPAGSTSLLTVSITPGANPTSTGITVTANLTAIGGAAAQAFFDTGTNGDVTAGDNIFSFNATVQTGTAPGAKLISATVSDAQSRTAAATISLTVTAPPVQPQTLPFSQNWSNTNLITTDNDWSSVPGIVGYRGDGLTTATGTDPQTILADGSATPVNVIANQTNPDTVTSGGNYEFELADPVVAFQGSGTASAPNIVINLNTTGQNNITISYNLRDVDGSTDNSVQPVALQYRVGNTGNYTNVPAAFVADASSGPSLATLVTPVAAALPAALDNQPLVQLRLITTNAVNNDELIGIDDIVVSSGGTLPLRATGVATPSTVASGDSTVLTVTVSPASNPTSTGITVTGNLSSIGGVAGQTFYDDGSNGDATAGDNTFSFLADVPAGTSSGARSLPISVADAETRTATTNITVTINAPANTQEHLVMGNPTNATTDVNNPFNYLLSKPQYVMSYHRDRGIPNWVSWHLDTTWLGSAGRTNDFRNDPSLPAGWYQVLGTDYQGSGFDRGHHTPSGDRTRTVPDNSATFFMTNMMPQAPGNNQGPWEKLESDSRTIAGQGNELYIVAAGTGIGGTGDNGGVTNTIANGHVTVPSYTWKVILIQPVGDNDVSRVTTATRTIAVIMPNNTAIRPDAWQKYLATVDQVEALTGYDFFSNVPVNIQNVIESRLDETSRAATPQNVSAGNYTNLDVTDTPNKTLTGNITVTGNLNLGGTTLTTGNFCVTLGENAAVSRTYGYVNGCVEKQFAAIAALAPAAVFEYPVGTNNGYSPVTANVTAVGQTSSSLSVKAVQGTQPNAPDPNLALKRYWTITETGDLTADLTFKYLDVDVPVGINESTFQLQRYESTFTQVPATIDPAANTASAVGISQFSDWTLLAPAAPTAANVEVSGRVTNYNGRGITGATVSLTAANGQLMTARTNSFGYFRFASVPGGANYVAQVRAKGYQFAPQVISLAEDVTDLNFTGSASQ